MRGLCLTFASPSVMMTTLVLLLLLSSTCAWSFSSLVDSFNGRPSSGSRMATSPSLAIGTHKADNGTELTGGKADASIIGAPTRRKFGRCKAGQRMDRRGKCRTVW